MFLTRKELDFESVCDECGGDCNNVVFILPPCHNCGLIAEYVPGSGVLELLCLECESIIAQIAVADR